MSDYVLTFESTHGAIATERKLRDQSRIVVIPTPRDIASGCGIALRFPSEDLLTVEMAMANSDLDSSLYHLYRYQEGIYTPMSPF